MGDAREAGSLWNVLLNRRNFLKLTGAGAAAAAADMLFNPDVAYAQDMEVFPTFILNEGTVNAIDEHIQAVSEGQRSLQTELGQEGYTNLVVSLGESNQLPVDFSRSPEFVDAYASLVKTVQTGEEDLGQDFDASIYLHETSDGLVALPMLKAKRDFEGLEKDGLLWLSSSGDLNKIEYPESVSSDNADIVVLPLTAEMGDDLVQVTGTLIDKNGQSVPIRLNPSQDGSVIVCCRNRTTGLMESLVIGNGLALIFNQDIPNSSEPPTPVPVAFVKGDVPTPEPREYYAKIAEVESLVVTDPEILKNAPAYIFVRSADGQYVQLPIDHFEQRGDRVFGVSETGVELAEYDHRQEPDSWFTTTGSDYTYLPVSIEVSTQLYSLAPLPGFTQEISEITNGRVNLDPFELLPNNVVDLFIRESSGDQELNIGAVGLSLQEFDDWMSGLLQRHGGIEPHPIYQNLYQEEVFESADPQNGAEQIFAVEVYLGALVLSSQEGGSPQEYYSQVAQDLMAGNSVVIELPDHSKWDLSKGIVFTIKRRFSEREIQSMEDENLFELNKPPTVHSRDGRLEINLVSYNNTSGYNSWSLMLAFSQIAAHYGASAVPDGASVDASEVLAILFHKDSQGNWQWPLETVYTNEDPVTSSSSFSTQFYPVY